MRNPQPDPLPEMPAPHRVVVRLHRVQTGKDGGPAIVTGEYETLTFDNVSVTQATEIGVVLISAERRFIGFFPHSEIRDVVSKENDVKSSGVVGVTLH